MTMTEHSVAPEDVMALLDGELSAADARVIQAHLEECDECSVLAEQLRAASESLSRWIVPAVPRAMEQLIEGRAEKADLLRRKRFIPRKWLALGGSAFVLGVLLLSVGLPRFSTRYAQNLPDSYRAEPSQTDALKHGHPSEQDVRNAIIPESWQGQAQMETGSIGKLQDKAPNRQVLHSVDTRGGAPPAVAGIAGVPTASQLANMVAAPPAPMIARIVSLSIRVKDANAARSSLDSIVARHHGYPAQLSMNSPENSAHYAQASLRIPAPELGPTIVEIKALGRVETESQSGEEVSQQHADLVARLKTARETETRFQAILQQRTGKISDVLEVEQNIARVRGDIEAMEAEQKALEHRVDFARVEVVLSEEYKAQLGSQPDSTSTRVHNAFVSGYHNATETLLGIVLFAEEYGPPVLIWLFILAVPAVVVWRRYRKVA